MGSMITANCGCGVHVPLLVGGGFPNFTTTCYFPCLCRGGAALPELRGRRPCSVRSPSSSPFPRPASGGAVERRERPCGLGAPRTTSTPGCTTTYLPVAA